MRQQRKRKEQIMVKGRGRTLVIWRDAVKVCWLFWVFIWD
jgi:hypothetical protein